LRLANTLPAGLEAGSQEGDDVVVEELFIRLPFFHLDRERE